MSYYRERTAAPLYKKDELLAAIADGSFLATAKITTSKQRKEEAMEYLTQRVCDRLLFVGPPTLSEWNRYGGVIEDVNDDTRHEDRYDTVGRFHPEWRD